jgi:DNA-binding NarL/FixJ family response regulator
VEAVRLVASRRTFVSAALAERSVPDQSRPDDNRYAALAQFTPRQLQLLCQLATGASVKEVARSLHLSPKSVDSHKYRIMQRLGIHDRVELARFAIREGLIEA